MDTQFSIISTAILLMFILDPFGNVPLVLALLKDFDSRKRYRIIAREVFIGLLILLVFLFFGNAFLNLFHLEKDKLQEKLQQALNQVDQLEALNASITEDRDKQRLDLEEARNKLSLAVQENSDLQLEIADLKDRLAEQNSAQSSTD